jgi:hypothetical protein
LNGFAPDDWLSQRAVSVRSYVRGREAAGKSTGCRTPRRRAQPTPLKSALIYLRSFLVYLHRVYRQADKRDGDRCELLYVPTSQQLDGPKGLLVGAIAGIPLVVLVTVSVLVSPTASVPAFVVVLAALVFWYRRRPKHDVLLSIADGVLTLQSAQATTTVRLDDVLDVSLDRETQTRIEYGTSATTALSTISVSSVEIAPRHILLVRRGVGPIKLGEPILEAHATEWMGRVRAFLRRSEWIPEDERPPVSSSVRPSSSSGA